MKKKSSLLPEFSRYHRRYWGVCGEFGWVRFLVVCFLYKTNPNPRKIIAVGKSGPFANFNLFFLGLGWPWVGQFVGFLVICICFSTQQNLVYRKHISSSLDTTPPVAVSLPKYQKKKNHPGFAHKSGGKSSKIPEEKKSPGVAHKSSDSARTWRTTL